MKKVIFIVIMVAAAWSVNAQEVTSTRKATPAVPAFIKADFEINNPGITVLAWENVQGYWRATYKADNRINYDYYDESGVDYRASLPVIQNNVPEAVVTTAINVHGLVVYGITKIKGANDTDIYQLRLMENGSTRIVFMDADGKPVTDAFKAKSDDVVVKLKP